MLVETGTGLRGADAYVSTAFATSYLTKMGRSAENAWSSSSEGLREAAIVRASQTLDLNFEPRMRGSRMTSHSSATASGSFVFSDEPEPATVLTVGNVSLVLVETASGTNEVALAGGAAGTAAAVAAALAVKWPGAVSVDGALVTVAAATAGASGDFTVISVSGSALVTAFAFTGGADEEYQGLAFPRAGLTDQWGAVVTGVPLAVKYSTVEYAVRAMTETLFVDPEIDSSGQMLLFKKETIGPISEESRYAQSFIPVRKISAVERMMAPFLGSAQGRTLR